MECTCGSEEKQKKRAIKIRRKYENLRRHHKKLLGVAIELTQVLEEYVRGQRSPNVTETLVLCSKIYPSLFDELSARTQEITLEENSEKRARKRMTPRKKEISDLQEVTEVLMKEEAMVEEANVNGAVAEEYLEGFLSKRELPRTPISGRETAG